MSSASMKSDMDLISLRTSSHSRMTEITAGAIAPGLKRYVPQVEMATRITEMWDGSLTVRTPDDRDFDAEGIVIAVVCLNALKVARSNPVDYLRTE